MKNRQFRIKSTNWNKNLILEVIKNENSCLKNISPDSVIGAIKNLKD